MQYIKKQTIKKKSTIKKNISIQQKEKKNIANLYKKFLIKTKNRKFFKKKNKKRKK
jgi:hypothetical protein